MQLVLNTFGTALRREGDRFLIQAGDRKLAFSAQKVQSILFSCLPSWTFPAPAVIMPLHQYR